MADASLKEVVRGRIRALRIERGLTQEALCERANVSVDAVNRIENGTRVPTIETLEKIATALGSSVTDLLHRTAARSPKHAPAVRRLLTLVENESADVQETVEALVRTALNLGKSKRQKRKG